MSSVGIVSYISTIDFRRSVMPFGHAAVTVFKMMHYSVIVFCCIKFVDVKWTRVKNETKFGRGLSLVAVY